MQAVGVVDTLVHLMPFDLIVSKKLRIGSANDGGYVMVDRLSSHQDVLSYGLSWNVTFDLDLAQRGHRIFMFDHTIEGLTANHANFNYLKEGVGTTSSTDDLLDTIDNHIARLGLSGDNLILKMDVEGAEWDVLDEMSLGTLRKFEQIVLELHDFRLIGDPVWSARAGRVLSKLAANFHLHHVHANNCAPIVVIEGLPVADVIEVSYIRNDLALATPSRTLFPTSLDACNDPTAPDHLLFFYPFHPAVRGGNISTGAESYRSTAVRVRHEASFTKHSYEATLAGIEPGASLLQKIPSSISKTRGNLDILLLSVHPVLEYDEISIFESLGHRVYSLGFYTDRSSANGVRPLLAGSDWHDHIHAEFRKCGCRADHNGATRWRVTPAFMKSFDMVIVDHDVGFIQENWPSFLNTPLIWRTIGQDSERTETIMRRYREVGAKIVRWSPEQKLLDGYAGADAFIRPSADPRVWGGWDGSSGRVVTFNNDFEARSGTLSYDLWKEAVSGLPIDLYGLRNDTLAEWRGTASFEDQPEILRRAGVAFVTGSRPAPFTLGFIEAWMTGVPVVHLGREVSAGHTPGVFEIDRLIEHGKTGFLADTAVEAREAISALLEDKKLAKSVSEAARERAIELFAVDRVRREWQDFFRDSLSYSRA